MALVIDSIEWPLEIEDKIISKHGVEPSDVESALLNTDPEPSWHKVDDGKYVALAQAEHSGEYLLVVFAVPRRGTARIISARPMEPKEKALFRRKRGIR